MRHTRKFEPIHPSSLIVMFTLLSAIFTSLFQVHTPSEPRLPSRPSAHTLRNVHVYMIVYPTLPSLFGVSPLSAPPQPASGVEPLEKARTGDGFRTGLELQQDECPPVQPAPSAFTSERRSAAATPRGPNRARKRRNTISRRPRRGRGRGRAARVTASPCAAAATGGPRPARRRAAGTPPAASTRRPGCCSCSPASASNIVL